MNARGLWGLGFLLALGLSVLGFFTSQVIINGRTGVNVATVKGLSERLVEADKVTWFISFSVNRIGEDIDKARFYQEAKNQRTKIYQKLLDIGFDTSDLTVSVIRSNRMVTNNQAGEIVRVNNTMNGQVKVATGRLDIIDKAVESIAGLVAEGIDVNVQPPEYTFTKLNEIKPEMLREATQNARIAAEQFALDAGVSVGGLQTVYQGGFTIRDANNERSYREEPIKLVRVVTTITFYLDN